LGFAICFSYCALISSAQFSGGPGSGGATTCLQPAVGLPVSILWMEADCNKGTSLLTWATGSELNNAHFIIERSADAEYWEEVARVSGAGNSQHTTEYAWRDEAPLAASIVYYRLRQVDMDGREEVLAVLPVEACELRGADLTVMPNPTDGLVEILWSTENGASSITELRLLDAMGRVLRNQHVANENGTRLTLDLSELAAGTYTVIGLDASGKQVGSARVVRQ